MISHVVLLKPKDSLSSSERDALLEAMRTAFDSIPQIQRVRIGKRKLIGRGYETQMATNYEFLCVIEFLDEGALRSYLDHPAHAELGRLFFVTAESALVYDFEMVEPARIRELL